LNTIDTTLQIKSIELPTGVELPYVEQGDPAGLPILFLHGTTDSWRSFETVLPHLPGWVHAFALTHRGHGDAGRPETGYYPADFAADAAAFVDALKLEPVLIAGHSMGGCIGMRFALDYPGRTLGLLLMAPFVTCRGNPVVQEFWDVAVSTLTDPVDPAVAREFQTGTLARPLPAAFLEMVIQESLKLPARVWKATFEALMADDFSGELGQIKAPTRLIWGDQDALFPQSQQEAIAAAIPGAELLIYSGAGHALHWEEPERTAADIVAFAEKFIR
jgi:pimeloyl-ACP methyl ester carboxylesterase